MFQHFTYKEVVSKKQRHRRKNYQFSFYYRGVYYHGIYHYNGDIEWHRPHPDEEDLETFEEQLQELMLYHVYDR